MVALLTKLRKKDAYDLFSAPVDPVKYPDYAYDTRLCVPAVPVARRDCYCTTT